MRTLVIGDIHGCYDELNELIDLFSPTNEDRIYSVGDIIGKGPLVERTLDLVIDLGIKSVIGNHEYWSLRKGFSEILEPYREYIESMNSHIDLGSHLIVHGGINPLKGLAGSSLEELTNIRKIEYRSKMIPWFELYKEDRVIIFGHWAKKGLVRGRNYIGLDSGAVYGKLLTGYIIEEDRFISVKSRKIYSPIIEKAGT